jgi:hypothetical protein
MGFDAQGFLDLSDERFAVFGECGMGGCGCSGLAGDG